jgi:drug/metabolite transporter (DMT)-like permease
MKPRDLAELLLLAAIWGGSFLFMRVAAPELAPPVVAFARVLLASLALLPFVIWRGQWPALRQHATHIGWVGLINSALPFLAYAYAATAITAGLSSVFNATTPLWAAVIAWVWLRDKPTAWRTWGLGIGFSGVMWLAWDKAGYHEPSGLAGPLGPIMACLGATLCYGLAANHARRFLAGVPALAVAAGSQMSATIALVVPAVWAWPAHWPSARALAALGLLGVLCTGLAYVSYFRLIARVGPARTVTVTFLVPAFAMLWGNIFLQEGISPVMWAACATILLGTSLVTGLIAPTRSSRNQAEQAPKKKNARGR